MAQTVAYIQEHGYDTRADFNAALTNAESQTSLARKKMKDTEKQKKKLKKKNEKLKKRRAELAKQLKEIID